LPARDSFACLPQPTLPARQRPAWPPILYCQRTHFSPTEQKKRERRRTHQRAIAAIPPAQADSPISDRLKLLIGRSVIRLVQSAEMTERWKAGEFDHLYGPYTSKGVLLKAPPKVYVEGPEKGGS
jgi:hypothetical protein